MPCHIFCFQDFFYTGFNTINHVSDFMTAFNRASTAHLCLHIFDFIITDINFALLTKESARGVEFTIGNSTICIPNAAISEQMNSEGTFIHC